MEENYQATAQQVAYFLLSNVLDLEKLSKEFSKSPSINYALGLVLDDKADLKIWNTMIMMFMYNRGITANVLGKLYADSKLRVYAINALLSYGIREDIHTQEDFRNAWIRVIENRKNEYKQIIISLKSFEK